MNEDARNFFRAVQTVAAMTALYRQQLIDQGGPPEEVEKYTCAFVGAMAGGTKNG